MSKHYTKLEKIEIINFYYKNSWSSTIKFFSLPESNLARWLKEYRLLGEEGLESGNGIQAQGLKRRGRPKTLNFYEMSKEELIKYIEVSNDIKKYLTKSIKKKYFVILQLKKKYQVSYLCYLLKVSKSGYYKWLKNGMNKFNKWNNVLARIIKNTFYKFKEIYGYQMITLWINKIYNLQLKSHIVYRYMRFLKLKAKVRKKNFRYKLSSGILRYDNILNRNFQTTGLNQKLGTDVTYLTTQNKTYYLSIVKDFHNNEILDYKLSSNLNLEFVFKNIVQAWVNAGQPKTWILQSDQGFHYTNESYKLLCEKLGIKISMSRRGCSPDNGSTESWFGTMKTEFFNLICRKDRNYQWIKDNLAKYIEFYNKFRPQAKLKGMSPIQYRMAHS